MFKGSNSMKDTSLSTLAIWAKELGQKEKFKEAEKYYTLAVAKIEASSNTTMSVPYLMDMLEGRADVRARMGRIEDALEDGNRMLKVDNANPRGYICLGKLLEKKGKPKSAQKCYDYGLNRCDQSHDKYSTMVKARNELNNSLLEVAVAKTKRDPVTTLPTEIILDIFRYLRFQDVIRCQRVSRFWRDLLTSEPSLYRSVDLTTTIRPLGPQQLKALSRYAAGNIHELRLGTLELMFTQPILNRLVAIRSSGWMTYGIMELVPLFKSLKLFEYKSPRKISSDSFLIHLPFFQFSNLQHLHLSSGLIISDVYDLLEKAPNLEYLHFALVGPLNLLPPRIFPNLKTLSLDWEDISSSYDFGEVAASFPGLEELRLINALASSVHFETVLLNLKVFRLEGGNHRGVYIASQHLTSLNVENAGHLDEVEISEQSSLTELTLNNIRNRQIVSSLCRHAKTLQKLSLASPFLDVKELHNFVQNGENLRYINVSGVQYVSDQTLRALGSLKSLERLDVDHCQGITGFGIVTLVGRISVKSGGKLSIISARGIESIRRQTIDWAWERGVVVRISVL